MTDINCSCLKLRAMQILKYYVPIYVLIYILILETILKQGISSLTIPVKKHRCYYFVPNNRSPASPKPGIIYACSFKLSSFAAQKIGTSG